MPLHVINAILATCRDAELFDFTRDDFALPSSFPFLPFRIFAPFLHFDRCSRNRGRIFINPFVAIFVHEVFFFRNVASVFRFYLFVSSIIKIIRKKERNLSRVPRTFSKNAKRLIFLFLPLLFYTLKYNTSRKKIVIQNSNKARNFIFVFLPPFGGKLWKIFVTRNSQNAKSLILFPSHSTTGFPDQS